MLHAGKVVSKSTLVEHVYGEDLDPDSNVLKYSSVACDES